MTSRRVSFHIFRGSTNQHRRTGESLLARSISPVSVSRRAPGRNPHRHFPTSPEFGSCGFPLRTWARARKCPPVLLLRSARVFEPSLGCACFPLCVRVCVRACACLCGILDSRCVSTTGSYRRLKPEVELGQEDSVLSESVALNLTARLVNQPGISL